MAYLLVNSNLNSEVALLTIKTVTFGPHISRDHKSVIWRSDSETKWFMSNINNHKDMYQSTSTPDCAVKGSRNRREHSLFNKFYDKIKGIIDLFVELLLLKSDKKETACQWWEFNRSQLVHGKTTQPRYLTCRTSFHALFPRKKASNHYELDDRACLFHQRLPLRFN